MDPHAHPPARTRIIALGDELMAGDGDARALGWIGRAVASEQGPEARLSLYSAALPGQTSAALADRWDAQVQERFDSEAHAEGRLVHRVVIGMGSRDIEQGISLARSRLNLAKVLDGLERLRLPAFVMGPPPPSDRGRLRAVTELSLAYEDVCGRRRIPFVDAVRALDGHEQWAGDLARSGSDLPGQTGYGLLAWLALHGGFGDWLASGS